MIIGGLLAVVIGTLAFFGVADSNKMEDNNVDLPISDEKLETNDKFLPGEEEPIVDKMKDDSSSKMDGDKPIFGGVIEVPDEPIALSDKQYHEANRSIITNSVENLIMKYLDVGLDNLTSEDFIVELGGAVEGFRFLYIVDHDKGVVGHPENSVGIYTDVPQLENAHFIWNMDSFVKKDGTQFNEIYFFKSFDGYSFVSGYTTSGTFVPEFVAEQCINYEDNPTEPSCQKVNVFHGRGTPQIFKDNPNISNPPYEFTPIQDLRDQGFYVDDSCTKQMVTILMQFSNMFSGTSEKYMLDPIGIPYQIPIAEFRGCESATLEHRLD